MAISTFVHDKEKGKPVAGWPDVVGYHEVTYEGAVLATGEYNGYDDSDFYADVWDEATNAVKRVTYATTRGWTYLNGASVDATPEVKAKAAAFYRARKLDALKAAAAEEARRPDRGKRVKVVRGRKVPKGTEGTVIWEGEGRYFGAVPRYRSGGWNTTAPRRIGLVTDSGERFFTAASNVEVLDAEEWLPGLDELEARADNWVAGLGLAV